MNEITTIGLDLAKNVFQVHGVDAEGTTVLRKQLRRGQVLAFFGLPTSCHVTFMGNPYAPLLAGEYRGARRCAMVAQYG